jgi:hypothetical protein
MSIAMILSAGALLHYPGIAGKNKASHGVTTCN